MKACPMSDESSYESYDARQADLKEKAKKWRKDNYRRMKTLADQQKAKEKLENKKRRKDMASNPTDLHATKAFDKDAKNIRSGKQVREKVSEVKTEALSQTPDTNPTNKLALELCDLIKTGIDLDKSRRDGRDGREKNPSNNDRIIAVLSGGRKKKESQSFSTKAQRPKLSIVSHNDIEKT